MGLAVSTMGLAPRPLAALPGGSGQMEVAGTVVRAAREAGGLGGCLDCWVQRLCQSRDCSYNFECVTPVLQAVTALLLACRSP